MTNYPAAPPELEPPDSRDYWSARPPWYAVLAGGGIFLILIVVLALLIADDDSRIQTAAPTLTSVSSTVDSGSTADTTTTTESPTTTGQTTTSASQTTSTTATSSTASSTTTTSSTAPSSTGSTTTTSPDPGLYVSAMWPWFDSTVRYDDPVDAARGFAEDFLGFDEPLVGPFQGGDSRSGEVEIRPAVDGPVTSVFVRQLGPENTWWVLGAATENIVIEVPDALDEIDSPLEVSGQALAFEGVVDVELRADGDSTPLITGSVTGGGTEMQPFEGSFTWTNPGEGAGAVVMLTRSMDDGRIWSVSAVRVTFAAG